MSQRQPLQQPHRIARCVKNVVACKSSTAASRGPAPSFHPLLFSFIFPSFLYFFLSLLLCSLPMPRCPVAHDKMQEPLVHSPPHQLYLITLKTNIKQAVMENDCHSMHHANGAACDSPTSRAQTNTTSKCEKIMPLIDRTRCNQWTFKSPNYINPL